MSICIRCGKCCRNATVCDLRGWILRDHTKTKIEGLCDQLIENSDGTTTCKVIESAITNPEIWYEKTRKWLIEEMLPSNNSCLLK